MGNWKDYFVASKKEKKGIFVLSFILILFFCTKIILSFILNNEQKIENKYILEDIKTFQASFKQGDTKIENQIIKNIELHFFDPNTSTKKEFLKLGLSEKQIKVISNFRNKGGKFFKPKDFKKIYVISDKKFKELLPFILINKENLFFKKKHEIEEKKFFLFDFDPNISTKEEFSKLGLSEKQIKVISNFRNKGGKFFKPEDFKKIYVISDKKFKELSSFIKIKTSEYPKKIKTEIKKIKININIATAEDLKKVSGIGEKLSKRIIDYRNSLGGFHNKKQLLEVYKLSKENLKNMDILVNKNLVLKLNINFSEINDFKKHPYITYFDAKNIVNFRTKNGSFKSVNDILDKKVLPKEIFEKIKFYLKI